VVEWLKRPRNKGGGGATEADAAAGADSAHVIGGKKLHRKERENTGTTRKKRNGGERAEPASPPIELRGKGTETLIKTQGPSPPANGEGEERALVHLGRRRRWRTRGYCELQSTRRAGA